jgi:hypothetical protein
MSPSNNLTQIRRSGRSGQGDLRRVNYVHLSTFYEDDTLPFFLGPPSYSLDNTEQSTFESVRSCIRSATTIKMGASPSLWSSSSLHLPVEISHWWLYLKGLYHEIFITRFSRIPTRVCFYRVYSMNFFVFSFRICVIQDFDQSSIIQTCAQHR